MSIGTSVDIVKKTRSTDRIREPIKYKVVICNDDVTPVDFVIALLVQVFNFGTDEAIELTMEVHESGRGVAGVFTFEVAEQKAIDGTNMARSNNFPLVIKLEPE